ncbi:MAG TPA: DUF664 domain-containing protein [Candidatus Dormibacteraeota bacterium]|nr:DUF664 domain-containing protein [Candidatus Dormibacteraeota bacterium]
MISAADYLYFVDLELDGMVAIVTELGDKLSNQRLAVSGANSPYVILNHCLGVIEYWSGHLALGRPSSRDREAEFTAIGPIAPLISRARQVRSQLSADLAQLRPTEPPLGAPEPRDANLPLGRTQGGALVHIHEELARHRGQMEVTRDVLIAGSSGI